MNRTRYSDSDSEYSDIDDSVSDVNSYYSTRSTEGSVTTKGSNNNTPSVIAGFVGLAVGIAGAAFAYSEHKKKQTNEHLLQQYINNPQVPKASSSTSSAPSLKIIEINKDSQQSFETHSFKDVCQSCGKAVIPNKKKRQYHCNHQFHDFCLTKLQWVDKLKTCPIPGCYAMIYL